MSVRQMTLAEYRSKTSRLAKPSPEQMENFAQFVSHAHSWYKHLPIVPPCAPLRFFVDPSAGMQRTTTFFGSLKVSVRQKTGFHYSWIPTQEYRDRFGYLAFEKSAGTSVSLHRVGRDSLIPSDDEPVICDPDAAELFRIPNLVLEAGTVMVSGIIHTIAADERLWSYLLRSERLAGWLAQSDLSLDRIKERCRELAEDSSNRQTLSFEEAEERGGDTHLSCVDYPLYQLLAPERRRQRGEMVTAMKRVSDLLFE